jgi:CBS domain containing-hemolysin-like protein
VSSGSEGLLGWTGVAWDVTQPLLEVFQTLLEEGVLSAPVWDESTSQYCGFVDLQDLLSYVVYEWDKVVRDPPAKPTLRPGLSSCSSPH